MAGQLWAVNSLGGFLYSEDLSDKLRVALQPMTKFRQFCDTKDETASGKGKGDTFKWDIVFNVATQGTTLTETTTMPETNFKILQASATINEAGNSVPYTAKLETLSKFSVKGKVEQALRNDAAKALDSMAYTEFNKCQLRVAVTGTTSAAAVTVTTNSLATITNNLALGKGHVRALSDIMQERNVPYYDGDNFVCIAHPTTLTTLKSDMEGLNAYVLEGYRKMMNGEIGKFENVRFVTQNNVAKASWTNAKSNWAFFFGKETVIEGIAEPEHVRAKIPDDYGRSKGIAWYYLGGFSILHNWDTAVDAGAANGRIFKWDSAA